MMDEFEKELEGKIEFFSRAQTKPAQAIKTAYTDALALYRSEKMKNDREATVLNEFWNYANTWMPITDFIKRSLVKSAIDQYRERKK